MDDAAELSIPAFVAACGEGPEVLRGAFDMSLAKASAICGMDRMSLLEIESLDLEERIQIELNVSPHGETYRPIERLSTGQQCTAILLLLLLDNVDPLIVDQPEDNLDNAFIADSIVQQLRERKTERQFVFATHNANIPVFGDAEWIGVFTASDVHGEVTEENQGSIDTPIVRDAAARILDGGREAFLQRREKYGY